MPILLTHWTYVTEKSSTTGFVSIRTGRDEAYRRRSTTKYSFLWSMHHKLLWWTEKCFQHNSCCLADNYEGTKFFNINAPGGCWKIFLLNAILACARGMGKMYCYSFIRYCSITLKRWSYSMQYIRKSHSNLKHINLSHKSEQ